MDRKKKKEPRNFTLETIKENVIIETKKSSPKTDFENRRSEQQKGEGRFL